MHAYISSIPCVNYVHYSSLYKVQNIVKLSLSFPKADLISINRIIATNVLLTICPGPLISTAVSRAAAAFI